MPDFDDSLGGHTLGDADNEDRFDKSLGDQHTIGDANIEEDLLDDGIKLEDLSERYTEERVLGQGGFGQVVLATDTRLSRQVAIKRILGKAARSKTATKRFLTEAQAIAGLNHNNIVQIYDYGRSTEGPFLIMECVQGGSLLDKCKEGPIEPEEAVNIFSQLCDGLAKAHAANIIHRDIKPANVLMTEDGVPKLTDFGLAKDDTADTGMTMEGAVIGTLDFMPPEQREGAHLTDHRSDLWSLAATFYQMVTGKSPKVINIAELPAKLQSVVAKSLEQAKDDRYQSALEMREAILQAHSGKKDKSRTLGEGECPECGTLNPPNGKFCVDCSAKLQVPCLQCQHPIQIWNKACGDCGAQQQSLVDAKLKELQGYHDQAESHLQDLEFDHATESASKAIGQDDPRLQKYSHWHEEFTGRLKQTQDKEHQRLKEILLEATAHEKAYDYEAGLRVLQQVAPSLLATTVNGVSDTASELKGRLAKTHSRLTELEKVVRERVANREISGLLPVVTELLTLRPDRPEVEKLKAQLEKRKADQLAARDAAYEKASECITRQEYAEAVATLNTVSPEVWNEQLEELKAKASDLLTQLNTLRDKIAAAVNANELRGLLPDVEACLQLKSDQDDLIKLKADLLQREAQIDASHQQMISQAQQLMQQLQFEAALEILGAFAPEDQTETTNSLTQQANHLLELRQNILNAAHSAFPKRHYHGVIQKKLRRYLSELSKYGVQDPQVQQMLEDVRTKESASIRTKRVTRTIVLPGFAVMAMIAGLMIKASLDLDTLENAITKGDWKTVLEIDPDNSDGLRLKADADKAAKIKNALAERDWETALALDPNNAQALRMKASVLERAFANGDWRKLLQVDPNNIDGLRLKAEAEKASAITEALVKRDWKTALSLDPNNSEALSLKSASERAAAVNAALAKGDWETALTLDPFNRKAVELKLAVERAAAERAAAEQEAAINIALAKGDWRTILRLDPQNLKALALIADALPDTPKRTLFLRGEDRVYGVDFSPDGKSIASAGFDGNFRLWNSQSGEELGWRPHRSSIFSVAFSPDSETIASASADNTIKLWDRHSGDEIKMLTGHSDRVTTVAFSPDGKTVISGSYDRTVKLWDSESGVVLKTLKKHSDDVDTVAFSPDGKTIASGSRDNSIKLWHSETGDELKTLTGHSGDVLSVAFSPDGKTIASGGSDKTIRLWDSEAGDELKTLTGHTKSVWSVAFSPNGKTIASGSWDATIKLWDSESGAELKTIKGHGDRVTSVTFSPYGKTIVSGSYDKTIKLWDVSALTEP